jgi:hypothetical protein
MGGASGDVGTGGATSDAEVVAGDGDGAGIGGAGGSGTGGGGTAGGGAGGGGTAGAGGVAGSTPTGGVGGFAGRGDCITPLRADDVVARFVPRTVNVTGLAPVYLPGGALSHTSGTFNLSHRPYAVRLPATYDPGVPLPVRFEGGGCGSTATNFAGTPTSQYSLDPQHKIPMIEVALSYIDTCFLDGGPQIDDRTDSPEVPYFRAVLADVEARYCVDRSRVFVAGTSSGAWEAELLGCAAADVVRGVASYSGGLRAHRPACKGPVAALMVGSTMDTAYPLGPLAATDPAFIRNDSPGLIPMRDDVLARNGCLGSATQPWNAAFPLCVTFTDCPPAFPVVWCVLSSSLRSPGKDGSVDYAPGAMLPFFDGLPQH